jgi:hypothetical protein
MGYTFLGLKRKLGDKKCKTAVGVYRKGRYR